MSDLRSPKSVSDPPVGPVVVIGAGPAGLTAAYELTHLGVPTTVFEQDTQVGGLARTIDYKNFKFDIGGHRFFTKVRLVQNLWRLMLGPDLLKRPRLSRIYYQGKFFHYPLKAANTLANLGVLTSGAVLASYLWAKASPTSPEVSFEDWISNRFGRRLFNIFFKSYTEKVWGIPCDQISAEWAAQRIKGLSLRTALINMLLGERQASSNGHIKTLIGEFEYPRLGPGMMWEAFQDHIEARGGKIELGTKVVGLVHGGSRVTHVVVEKDGKTTTHEAAHVIATMPIRELLGSFTPALPRAAQEAANRLKYRDFVTVALILNQRDVFPDNWIYVHDPSVKVGRIQNFKNWSPEMVPDESMTCLGLEYFCSEGDELWTLSDEAFIDLAPQGSGVDRVNPSGSVRGRKGRPRAKGVSRLRRRLRRCAGRRPPPPRAAGESSAGRPQRHAQVQQPGPLDADRHAGGAESLRRASRHLGRERRRRVPRRDSRYGVRRQRARRRPSTSVGNTAARSNSNRSTEA